MSNYSRKARRTKAKQAEEQKIARNGYFNKRLTRIEGRLVCPYNHQECKELNCKGCRIYEAVKADQAFDSFIEQGGHKQKM